MKRFTPRRFDRQRFLAELRIRPVPGGAAFAANALDLSAAGIALFAARFLEVGQQVELYLRTGGATPSEIALPGRVVYARPSPDGTLMGLVFGRLLSADELKALGGRRRS